MRSTTHAFLFVFPRHPTHSLSARDLPSCPERRGPEPDPHRGATLLQNQNGENSPSSTGSSVRPGGVGWVTRSEVKPYGYRPPGGAWIVTFTQFRIFPRGRLEIMIFALSSWRQIRSYYLRYYLRARQTVPTWKFSILLVFPPRSFAAARFVIPTLP